MEFFGNPGVSDNDCWDFYGDECGGFRRKKGRSPKKPFVPDRNYYHGYVEVDKIVIETEKAFRVIEDGLEFWLPKSITREIKDNKNPKLFFVHTPTYLEIQRLTREQKTINTVEDAENRL